MQDIVALINLTNSQCLLCVRHSSKHFPGINSLNSHSSWEQKPLLFHFTPKKTEARSLKDTEPDFKPSTYVFAMSVEYTCQICLCYSYYVLDVDPCRKKAKPTAWYHHTASNARNRNSRELSLLSSFTTSLQLPSEKVRPFATCQLSVSNLHLLYFLLCLCFYSGKLI